MYLKMYCYTYLLVSVDRSDLLALNTLDKLGNLNDEFENSFIIFSKWLSGISNVKKIFMNLTTF